jgi:hypothetical protein
VFRLFCRGAEETNVSIVTHSGSSGATRDLIKERKKQDKNQLFPLFHSLFLGLISMYYSVTLCVTLCVSTALLFKPLLD